MNKVLCLKSIEQLKAIFEKYEEISEGKKIEEDIESEMSSDVKDGYLALGKYYREIHWWFISLRIRDTVYKEIFTLILFSPFDLRANSKLGQLKSVQRII